MIFGYPLPQHDRLRGEIANWHRRDETEAVEALLDAAHLEQASLDRITERARALVGEVRRHRIGKGGIDAFMQEYELSSQEGVVLMCLAEDSCPRRDPAPARAALGSWAPPG